MNAEQALAFVEAHGVVLVSAKGSAPNLVEAIVGQPVKGSWWAHSEAHRIFATLNAVAESDGVLVCRLVGGKVTLVHRRLWPALARLAAHFPPERIARVHQEHTESGQHVNHAVPFPQWTPEAALREAAMLSEEQARAALGAWIPQPPAPAGARRAHARL